MGKINEIVLDYLEAAIKYGEQTQKNNSKKANKEYTKIKINYDILKAENSLKELLPYLEHNEDYVKLWVSAHLLNIEEIKAMEVLERLSKKKEMIGFEAKMTLEQWKKGELTF